MAGTPATATWDATVAVVNKQLESYNNHDLEAFMETLAEDVYVADTATGAVIAIGKEQLRPRYVERFKSPVHAEVISRTTIGNVVVDREVIRGLPNGGEADCMATYVVDDGKISRIGFVWVPRNPSTSL